MRDTCVWRWACHLALQILAAGDVDCPQELVGIDYREFHDKVDTAGSQCVCCLPRLRPCGPTWSQGSGPSSRGQWSQRLVSSVPSRSLRSCLASGCVLVASFLWCRRQQAAGPLMRLRRWFVPLKRNPRRRAMPAYWARSQCGSACPACCAGRGRHRRKAWGLQALWPTAVHLAGHRNCQRLGFARGTAGCLMPFPPVVGHFAHMLRCRSAVELRIRLCLWTCINGCPTGQQQTPMVGVLCVGLRGGLLCCACRGADENEGETSAKVSKRQPLSPFLWCLAWDKCAVHIATRLAALRSSLLVAGTPSVRQ